MIAIKGILGGIRQADQKFDFFHSGDRIMIGISGGKDSMVLAYALSLYQKFNFVNFTIVPAIIDLGFPGFDAEPIKHYLATIGLNLEVIDAKDVYKILSIQQKDKKILPCSICSRMKKAAINKAAKQLNCNKVSFAHHADDAIETLLMNEIYGGRIATFQPKMHLDKVDLDFIRPLILIRESEIIACQKECNIPSFSSHCPNEGETKRQEMKMLLSDIYKKYPISKNNFLTMLSNYSKQCLFSDDIFYKIEKIDISFKPIINNIDSLNEQKLRKQNNDFDFDPTLLRYLIYFKNKIIGYISFKNLEKNEIEIKSFYLKNKYKYKLDKIFKYIEKEICRRINPVTIKISSLSLFDIAKINGYKKAHKYGLIKTIK